MIKHATWLIGAILMVFTSSSLAAAAEGDAVPVIFDTDMGNDIDDVFAMGILHALESRGECKIIAVTVSKDHPLAGPFTDVINTFYGRGGLPLGVLRTGKASDDGRYLVKVMAPRGDGSPAFPHRLKQSSDAPSAVAVMRKTLAAEKDGSVLVVAVGPMTNLANLLDSPADEFSALSGADLIAKKVRMLEVMAGDFSKPRAEFNVFVDGPAAAKVFERWPTEIVACPFDMGEAVHYPEMSLLKDFRFAGPHPLVEANRAMFGKLNGFMAWDLVATLHAIRPGRDYVGISKPGVIRVDKANVTHFEEKESGKHRYLIPPKNIERVREALANLASQPPLKR